MNIIKGLDRISLIIAILAGVFGFFGGGQFIYDNFKTEKPEYKTWVEKYGVDFHPSEISPKYKDTRPPKPDQYKYPPLWIVLPSGAAIGGLTFIVALFGLRGTTRLFVWVVKGFKDE